MKNTNSNHRPWTITAKAKGEIEILLYEMIGLDFWTGEGTTAKSFAEDLKAAGAVSKIHLRVNSPGGNVFDGIAIYNTLLSHGAVVTAQVDGIAASIASVIIMAATEISMGDNAMMMIHNPGTAISGDSNKMRKMAETMDKVKTSMVTAYRRHSAKSVEEIGALMDAETWMTAQETVDNGFAEKVTTPEGDAADVAANFDLTHFRKVPQQIAAMFGFRRISAEVSLQERIEDVQEALDAKYPNPKDTWPKGLYWAIEVYASNAIVCSVDDSDKFFRVTYTVGDDGEEIMLGDALEPVKKTWVPSARAADRIAGFKARLLAEAKMCACECSACMKDDCGSCDDESCTDANCEACPMQTSAQARTGEVKRLAAETSNLRAKVSAAERALADERRTNAGWMQRVSGKLEESAAVYVDAMKQLPRERANAEALIVQLSADLESSQIELAAEKAARLEDATIHVTFGERLTADLRAAASLHATAVQELPAIVGASETRIAKIQSELESTQTGLAAEKQARLEDSASQSQWSERMTAELRKAAILFASAMDELPRRVRRAELLIGQIDTQLAAAKTALVPAGMIQILEEQRKTRSEEAVELRTFTDHMAGELSKVATLYASAVDELPRRARSAESRGVHIKSELDAMPAVIAAGQKSHTEEVAARAQAVQSMTGELQKAATLYTAAAEELPRRVRADELRITQISGEVESLRASNGKANNKVRAEASIIRAGEIERMTGKLQQATALYASAVEEIARRSRMADLV